MSETCPRCNKGNLNFYDGAFEHNPRWVCSECNAYFEEAYENLKEFMGFLE